MTKYYCITMPSTPERTAFAKAQFDREGVEVDWVYGIDAVSFAIKPALYMHAHGGTPYYISPGACALVLSHYMAFRYAERDGVDDFVVFEDDVILPSGFLDTMEHVKKEARSVRCNAVWLEYCCLEPSQMTPVGNYIRKGWPLCTAAVWYTKEAIPTLIQAIQPAHAPVDILLKHRAMEHLNAHVAYPQLCFQEKYNDTLGSTIHRQVPEHPKECID